MVTNPEGIRLRLLVAVAVVVGGACWVVLKILRDGGRDLPNTSWLTVFIFVAFAVGLLVAGRPVRRLVQGRATRTVSPMYAARVLAMAQAAALAGAAILGWYVAQVVILVPDADIPSRQQEMLTLGVLALGAVALSWAGLIVQRWCRVDPTDRDARDERDDRTDPEDSSHRH